MAEKTVEPELVEKELETTPEAGGLVAVAPRQTIEDQLFLAENIEKIVAAQNKIRMAVLKLAQPGDWVLFGSGEKAKAEIGHAGAGRIGSTLGISFVNWSTAKFEGTDESGQWYRWEFECDAIYGRRTIRVFGRASSRDVFFGKEDGEWKPLHELNEGNIKMAARRAAMKEGVKQMFGLHHMDPEELKKHGVVLAGAAGYAHKDKEGRAAEGEAITTTLETVKLVKSGKGSKGPWSLYAIKGVDGDEFITFSDSIFTQAQKFLMDKVQVTISFKKTDRGSREVVAMTQVAGAPAPAPAPAA